MKELFEEYEAGETPEALLVKDFDKVGLQVLLHACCFLVFSIAGWTRISAATALAVMLLSRMVGSAEMQQPIVRSSHRHVSSVSIDVPLQLEMILQALEYEAAQGLDLQEFFNSTAGRFKTETGRAWAAEIVARRIARAAQNPARS